MVAWKSHGDLTAINAVSALLGAVLFLSPWVFGFSGTAAAAWNAWICGIAIVAFALAAVADLRAWEEWANLIVGAWTVVAAWVLGFAGIAAAMWTHVGVGLVVAILAAAELWLLHGDRQATKAV